MTKYYKIYLIMDEYMIDEYMIDEYIRLNIYLKLSSQQNDYNSKEELEKKQTNIQTLFRIKHDYLRNIELSTFERYSVKYEEDFIKNMIIEKKHMMEYDDKSIYENHLYMRVTPTKMFDK